MSKYYIAVISLICVYIRLLYKTFIQAYFDEESFLYHKDSYWLNNTNFNWNSLYNESIDGK